MRIGLDVMGGDHAPEATVLGAILAFNELPEDVKLVLIGDETHIKAICKKENFDAANFSIVHSSEVIEMGDNPLKAFTQKTNSSINIGFNLLKNKEIDGFASVGNTGAMLVGAMYTVKSIQGIIRPAITAALPQENDKVKILLDVGINPDCKPDVLYQWAILGKVYAENIFKINNPRVALLNIGEEEEKGNLLTKSAYSMMKGTKEFNFTGNIEGNNLFDDTSDVVVCDGFVGNVVLKEAEAFYALIQRQVKGNDFLKKFNFELYGGTPVLGINNVVMIGHGKSGKIAIRSMINQTKEVISIGLIDKIKQVFS